MPDINQLLDLSPPLGLILGLNFLMAILKYSFKDTFPKRLIPALCFLLGGLIFPLIAEQKNVPYNMVSPLASKIIMGFVLGGCAVGGHQLFVNLLKNKFGIVMPGDTDFIEKPEEKKEGENK